MYPRSFLCEEAKIKQRTPLKKELCEIGEEAIWDSRFISFFFYKYHIHFCFLQMWITSRVEAVAVCVNVWLDGLRHTAAY